MTISGDKIRDGVTRENRIRIENVSGSIGEV